MARLFPVALFAFVSAMSVSASRANIYTEDKIHRCMTPPPDEQIAACAALLEKDLPFVDEGAAVYSNRAAAYVQKGDYDLAIADANEALARAPNADYALANRAAAYRGKGDLARALTDYERAVALNSRFPGVYSGRGWIHWDQHDFDGAYADFNSALSIDFAYGPALAGRCLIFFQRGLSDSAMTDCDNAAHYRLDDAATLNAVCYALTVGGKELDRALSDCDKALKILPGNPAVLDSRGFVYLKLGRFDEAIADYNAALAKRPKLAASLYGRGIAKKHTGDVAGGQTDIRNAEAIDPKTGEIFERAGLRMSL